MKGLYWLNQCLNTFSKAIVFKGASSYDKAKEDWIDIKGCTEYTLKVHLITVMPNTVSAIKFGELQFGKRCRVVWRIFKGLKLQMELRLRMYYWLDAMDEPWEVHCQRPTSSVHCCATWGFSRATQIPKAMLRLSHAVVGHNMEVDQLIFRWVACFKST